MSASSSGVGAATSPPAEATRRMNRMYRLQRYIYDGTRRYYLLGRDGMISNLQPSDDATVLEIGCGTGRNLVLAAGRYPKARFFGIDVSTEMLASATSAISRDRLTDRVSVAHGDATGFDAQALFGIRSFDHIFISYSLSMIPDWRLVLEMALGHLEPGGRLHVVDFGQQEQWPRMPRALLRRWLALFDVTPRDDIQPVLTGMADVAGAMLKFERPFRGYVQYAVLALPLEPRSPMGPNRLAV